MRSAYPEWRRIKGVCRILWSHADSQQPRPWVTRWIHLRFRCRFTATAETDVWKTAAESGYMQRPVGVGGQRGAPVHSSTSSIAISLLLCSQCFLSFYFYCSRLTLVYLLHGDFNFRIAGVTRRWRHRRRHGGLRGGGARGLFKRWHFKVRVSVNFLPSSDVESGGDMLVIILDSLYSFMASNALALELPSIVFERHLAVILRISTSLGRLWLREYAVLFSTFWFISVE